MRLSLYPTALLISGVYLATKGNSDLGLFGAVLIIFSVALTTAYLIWKREVV
jgi:hypothetical protein